MAAGGAEVEADADAGRAAVVPALEVPVAVEPDWLRPGSWESEAGPDWGEPKTVGDCRAGGKTRSQVAIGAAVNAGETRTFHSRTSPASYAACT